MKNDLSYDLNEVKLNEILKEILRKRRFNNIEELKNTIKNYMKINLIDINKYDVRLSYKPEYEMGEYPEDCDYVIIGCIEGNNDIFDFDLYYAVTRNEQMYITEYIII